MWDVRDWISALIGWASAIAVGLLLPDNPYRAGLIFMAGFCPTWIVRELWKGEDADTH